MKRIIVAGMVLLPQLVFAGTDCWFDEYPDHYVAVCIGDEKAGPVPTLPPVADRTAITNGSGPPPRSTEPDQSNTTIYSAAATMSAGAAQGASPAKSSAVTQSLPMAQSASATQQTAQVQIATQTTGQALAEMINAPRPGRMSKARVDAAMAARNKILQSQ